MPSENSVEVLLSAPQNELSTAPAIAARISGPVVCACTHAFAWFSNWHGRNQPCVAASSRALMIIPLAL
jgi:hypothetical protein